MVMFLALQCCDDLAGVEVELRWRRLAAEAAVALALEDVIVALEEYIAGPLEAASCGAMARYTVGEAVEAERFPFTWYRGTVEQVRPDSYAVRFEGSAAPTAIAPAMESSAIA